MIGSGSAGRGPTTAEPSVVRISPSGAVTALGPLGRPTDIGFANLTGVAVLPDGRIMVGGTGAVNTRDVFLAALLSAAGSPDASFSDDGWARADFGPATRPRPRRWP